MWQDLGIEFDDVTTMVDPITGYTPLMALVSVPHRTISLPMITPASIWHTLVLMGASYHTRHHTTGM